MLGSNKNYDNRSNPKEGPKENERIKKFIKSGELPTGTTVLYGYVGSSDTKDVVRLYKDLSFKEYYEINNTDIKDWIEETDEDKDPFGGTYIFVDSDAEIKIVHIEVTKVRAKFLAGIISKEIVRPPKPMIRRLPPQEREEAISYYVTCDWTCGFTCGQYTCAETCGNTCDYTCMDTCGYTCLNTCEYTCLNTCEYTCGNTCEYTCNTCDITCNTCVCEGPGARPFRRQPRKRMRSRYRRY